jgi:conjugal transfer pilus assembly protein TraF
MVSVLLTLSVNSYSQEAEDKKHKDYIKEIEQKSSKPIKAAGETDLGWNFYFPDRIKEIIEPQESAPPSPSSPSPQKAPPPMSVEWFQQNYETIRNRAVNEPTPENLRAELYAQRVMMDKSEVFARRRQHVQKADPYLQEGDRLPLFGATSLAMVNHQQDLKKEATNELLSSSALLVFYDHACTYCRRSVSMLNYLTTEFKDLDLRVMARNTPSPDSIPNLFPSVPVYPDELLSMSEKLGVTTWPSYLIVTEDETVSVIARGMVPYQMLVDRMLVAGFETGVLGKSWYERIYQNERGLIAASAYDALPENISEDPVLLINSVIEMINNSNDTSFYDDLFLNRETSSNNNVIK